MRIPRLLAGAVGPAAMALVLAGCPPKTQMGAIAPAQLQEEQLKQQQLVITSEIREQQRLSNVAYPMLKAAVPLCGKWVAQRSGVFAINAWIYNKDFQPAARSLGYGDTLVVAVVASGSMADRAGVKVGDRIVEMDHRPAPVGKGAAGEFFKRGATGKAMHGDTTFASEVVPVTLRRTDSTGTHDIAITIPADTTCVYGADAVKSDALNAWADGQRVVVTTAMMRFAASDDELAVVVSHEIAHDAMRHMDAKKKGAILGSVLGAALDVAAATQGINTGGGFSNSGAAVGANAYSQDFEREADYVGMYILARAGRPYADSPNFWRRMAQESPGSIKYASTHPTSAERFIRLDRTAAEIKAKVDAGKPLLPEAKVPGTESDSAKGR